MSFLSRLFGKGGGGADPATPGATAELDYKGFMIRAAPRKEHGQYLVAGSIEKMVDGVLRQHQFVRADRSPNLDEITEMALMKGRLMVDQQGEGLFG